jgi:2-polyprenyl-6-methoxyphenol hydroxylase-like FAD-dependent oxidoreductase
MPTFDRAIVLGGSIAGLLAAAALSRSFARVTVVDRDELLVDGPDAQSPRRGVPHATQVHHLLSLGQQKVEALLPGLSAELTGLGCETYDDVADFSQFVNGAWRMRVKSDLTVTMFRRPVFEWAIRSRVLALPNVSALKGLAVGLVGSADGSSVTGARVRGVDGGVLTGDFVVDCTGRGSRASNWIEDLGYPRPAEQQVRIHMGYSTFTARIPAGSLPKGLAGISVSATPASPMGAAIRPCGNALHDVTAYGLVMHYPPDDFDSIMAFFETLSSPLIAQVMREATITSEIDPYQMPGNQRRLWEQMSRRPERFVVAGDAVTSFNPIYGQGMTMAALDASILGDTVAEAASLDGTADEIQKAYGPLADVAWDLAVGLDSAYPEAEYDNVEPPSDRDRARARAFGAAQTSEPLVRVAVRATALYMDTAFRDAPAVRGIVADWLGSGRTPDPAVTDPADPPGISDGYVRAQDLLAAS